MSHCPLPWLGLSVAGRLVSVNEGTVKEHSLHCPAFFGHSTNVKLLWMDKSLLFTTLMKLKLAKLLLASVVQLKHFEV